MAEILAGLTDGTIEIVPAPPAPEFEEMQAWHDWFLLSAMMCAHAAWAFGLIAAWGKWRRAMDLAAQYVFSRDEALRWMVKWRELDVSPVIIVRRLGVEA